MTKAEPEIAAIALHSVTYQGDVVRHYSDGNIAIDTSVGVVTGPPVRKTKRVKTDDKK